MMASPSSDSYDEEKKDPLDGQKVSSTNGSRRHSNPRRDSKQFGNNGDEADDAMLGENYEDDDEEDDYYYDEEGGFNEDPYVYSDDSASLSDAYFFPQPGDDLAKGAIYKRGGGERGIFTGFGGGEQEPLVPGNNPQQQQHHHPHAQPYHPYPPGPFPLAPPYNYGSLAGGGPAAPAFYGQYPASGGTADQHQAPSPLWIHGAIQEDAEVLLTTTPAIVTCSSSDYASGSGGATHSSSTSAHSNRLQPSKGGGSRKERRRQRRIQRHSQRRSGGAGGRGGPRSAVHRGSGAEFSADQQHPAQYRTTQQQKFRIRQREQQVARERAVARVRGQAQKEECHKLFYAVVFLTQFVIVALCALVLGLGLIQIHRPEDDDTGSMNDILKSVASAMTSAVTGLTDSSSPSSSSLSSSSLSVSSSYKTNSVSLTTNKTSGQIVYTDDAFDTQSGLDSSPATAPTSSAEAAFFMTFDYENVVELVAVTGFYACIMTYISFGFMLILAKGLIQTMLVFSILLSLAWGLIGLSLDPYGVISIMGFFFLLLTLGYAMYNWNRIPFAATNLYTALCAMRCTADITIVGLTSLIVAFGWCVIWSIAFVGLIGLFHDIECYDGEKANECDAVLTKKYWPVFLILLISFHWTNTVIKNVVRVTVSSVIATWWFQPDQIGPFCTGAVRRPLLKSMTKSFGSICEGSLIINFVQIIRLIGSCCDCVFGGSECMNHRKHNEVVVGSVVPEVDSAADSIGIGRRFCSFCDRINSYLRCCNRWAFTYIGMYGYNFIEGGERALQLFETREWLDVVRDNLIQNVLSMGSMVIGGSAGTFSVIIQETDGSSHVPTFSAFVIGSVLGYVLSNTLLLGIVGSAVNTVLVCFAAGPFEFEKTHPRLSQEMREIWSQYVWEDPST